MTARLKAMPRYEPLACLIDSVERRAVLARQGADQYTLTAPVSTGKFCASPPEGHEVCGKTGLDETGPSLGFR